MSEKLDGGISPQEHKEIPEPIKHLGKFTKTFSFVPYEKAIISSTFEGARKPEESEESIGTELRFISIAPVMEALSLRLQQLYKEAFNEKGEMLNYDKILDINGLLLFLMDFYDSAKASGRIVKEENLIALEDALSDLNKFIEQDPYNE